MSIDNISIDKLRSLVELMEEKELQTLEVSSGDDTVKVTRYYEPAPAPIQTVVTSAPQAVAVPNANSTTTASSASSTPAGNTEDSPMIGVFYSAASPNDPPFVTVGQKVKAGDQLGIIEAMKIMNPLEATQSGVIAEILVENGQVVEFGQPVIRYKS